MRGGKISALLSGQASHAEREGGAPWRLDCGLCAAKNVTVNSSLTLPGMLAVARPLQSKKDAEMRAGERGANFLVEGVGNFNGRVIVDYLEQHGYHCVFGSGYLGEIVQTYCLAFGERVVGVMWRVGHGGARSRISRPHPGSLE